MKLNFFLLNFILFFVYHSSFSQRTETTTTASTNPIQQYAESMTGFKDLTNAAFAFCVKDLGSGEIIADINKSMSIPAASTMKLVTTSCAIQILGTSYRFKTSIGYSGVLNDSTGVLDGDLYIIGGGDPTLGSKYYNKEGNEKDFLYEWADTIKKMGIKQINGRIIADASLYKYQGVPSGWVWGDMGNYYGAGPSGLTIYDNMLKITFKTGEKKGDPTEIICMEPYIPLFQLLNTVSSDDSSRDNAYVFGAPYSNDWFVSGSIPKNKEEFTVKASIPDPEYVFAIEFASVLAENGIQFNYAPTTYRKLTNNSNFIKPEINVIYTHSSPSLTSIINWTNERSVNLFAEHLLTQISVHRSGYGSTYNGSLICEAYWKTKIGSQGLFMTDGSGLSRSNAVSPMFFVEMLNIMKSSSTFKSSLAICGKKGTMASLCKGTVAEGRVSGKSGTMTRMKAYTGYVDTKNGKKLAYAMVLNNYNCSTSQATKYFENLMIKMANY